MRQAPRSPLHYSARALWLVLHLAALLLLYTSGLQLRSDVFELIADPQEHSEVSLAARVLAGQSSRVRFVLQGDERGKVLRGAAILRDYLRAEPNLALLHPPSEEQLQKLVLPYLARAPWALLDQSQRERIDQGVEPFIDALKQKLYSPLASYYSIFLEHDPLLLIAERLLRLSASSEYSLESGAVLRVRDDEQQYSLLLLAEVLDSAHADTAVRQIETVLSRVAEDPSFKALQLEMRYSSALAFAASSEGRFRTDIERVSSFGSVLGIILLLAAFGSLRALSLSLVSIASGMLFGITAVHLVFGSVHLLTIGIAAALMGACIDYSLHYLNEQVADSAESACARTRRPELQRALIFGAGTSILAFVALSFSSFPGLRQLSLFASCSLFASVTTVLLLGPLFVRPQEPLPKTAVLLRQLTATCIAAMLSLRRYRIPATICLVLLLVTGLSRLTVFDDIRALQTPAEELIERERWIAEIAGFAQPQAFVIVHASTASEVFAASTRADAILREGLRSQQLRRFESSYGIIPTPEQQEANFKLFRAFLSSAAEALEAAMHDLGYPEALRATAISLPSSFTALRHDELLTQLPYSSRRLLEPQRIAEGDYYTAIPLFELSQDAAIRSALEAIPGVHLFIPTVDISRQFAEYRRHATQLVLFAYGVIACFFLWRYGWQEGTRALLALCATVLSALATAALFGLHISFFSLLALLIVMGLSVDFAIFLLEKHKSALVEAHTHANVVFALSLSALSSVLTFGLLAMSSTEVLHSIGFIVSFGVLCSLGYSLLLLLPLESEAVD